MSTQVTIQYFDGCPSWTLALENLEAAAREVGVQLDVTEQLVETSEDAERLGFVGSPTILLGGTDPFAPSEPRPALACRLFETPRGPSGSPTVAQLVTALRSAQSTPSG
ncbi:MAG: thioredoxin family protein [Terrabacter sp.]|nr:thioredoxin family protein [Dermatophilaceae bacterium]NUS40827.1 thioredoxin family protein [Terrabacter sp.]